MKYLNTFKLFESESNMNSNFKKWFGKSKVVVKSGKPLIVYHGTSDKNFKQFDLKFAGSATDSGVWGKGFYFSDKIEYASTYNRSNKGGILKCYLSLQNPLILNSESVLPKIEVPRETMEDLLNGSENYSRLFREHLIKNGYDGVISHYRKSSGIEFVSYYPNQIKSIENDGTWSLKNNNIYS